VRGPVHRLWAGLWTPRRALERWRIRRSCPHPLHRARHVHGDERNHGYVAFCGDCGRLSRAWPGGDHDATPCQYRLR
jgi:hypothetical protein